MNFDGRPLPFLFKRFLIALLLTLLFILISIYGYSREVVVPAGDNSAHALLQCAPFPVPATITHVTCAGASTGKVQLGFITGGTGPYTYSWSHMGGTGNSISNKPAGTYTVEVTDANGCQSIVAFTILENLAPGPAAPDVITCKWSPATLTASGAPANGSYKWYTTATGNTVIPAENGSTYVTGKIKSTKAWYVSKVDGAGCESARTMVTANMRNPLYPVVDLDSAMIMHYKFDNNLLDSTTRNGAATLQVNGSYTTDRNAKATSALNLPFDSHYNLSNYGYLDFPASADLQALTDKITISIWIKRNFGLGTIAPLINKWENDQGFFIGSQVADPAIVERRVLWKLSSTAQLVSGKPIPEATQWHHIVCVYTGSELQIYQNGELTASTSHTGNIPATTVNMAVARVADASANSRFTGVLDELRIYNRSLSAGEIKTLYNNESIAFNNSPVCAESAIDLSAFAVPGAAFLWTGVGGFSASQQNPSIASAASAHAGSYSLIVSRSGCSTPPQKTSVAINALPSTTVSASGATTFCEGGDVTLTAPAAASWLWSNGATTRSITVSQNGNYAVEVKGTNGCADTSAPQAVTVNPVNDAPSFTKGSDVVINEDAAAQTVTTWASAISAGPGEATQVLTFHATTDNTTLFSVQPSVDAAGSLTFTPAPDAWGTAQVTLSLQDNGGTGCSGTDRSADQAFSITINNVNDVPFFTKGGDITVNEDEGPQTLNAWAVNISAGANDPAQTLSLTVSNDNNALFTVQPSVNASGDLTFTPAPDAYGVAQVTLSLKDNGGTANGGTDQSADQVFTITVSDINDAPSFTKGSDVTVNEDAGPQTISAWATDISSGAGDPAQTLSFAVSNNNNTLFTTQPSVNASGDLTFTPAPGAYGVAAVTLSLKDNGGTAHGGTDQSVNQAFTITIRGVNDAPSFTKGDDVTVNEDAAPYNAPWAIQVSAGDRDQEVTFVVSVSRPELFAAQPAVSPSGVLSFSVKPDASGSAAVSVYIKDDGGTTLGADQSEAETFNIVITPVNDAPLADPVADVTVPVNSEPVVITLTGLQPGADEESQQLSITGTSDNPGVLSDIQLTSLAGETASLTLSPVPDMTGTVTLTIRIKDNGGTNSGGVDETILTFTLTITEEIATVFLPNLFSPDGNGTNDVFRVRGAGIAQIRFCIYNTEGREMFSTTDVTTATETGWDGRYRGNAMPAGAYIWTLQGSYVNGKPLTTDNNKSGQFILMR